MLGDIRIFFAFRAPEPVLIEDPLLVMTMSSNALIVEVVFDIAPLVSISMLPEVVCSD